MKLTIKNFKGIENAVIEIIKNKITLVGGLNYQGKTSIAQAVGCLMSGDVFPYGIKKNKTVNLVRGKKGHASISSDEPDIDLTWPECSIIGNSDNVSKTSVGMESILDMDIKSRSNFLNDVLKANPSKEDLEKKLNEIGLGNLTDNIWKNIEGLYWDSTYKKAKETGAKLKGAWEEITGDNYGSKKAADWFPDNWDVSLEKTTEKELQEKIDLENDFVEAAIAHTAISNEQVKALEAEAKNIKTYMEDSLKVGQSLEICKDGIFEIEEKLKKLPVPKGEGSAQKCPSCKTLLRVSNGKILKADTTLTKEAKAKIEKERKTLSIELDNLTKSKTAILNQNQKLEVKINIAKDAMEKLKNASTKEDGNGVDDVKNRLKLAQERLVAFNKKHFADNKTTSISKNKQLCDILAPDGLRKEKLQSVLHKLNEGLKIICNHGKWKNVKIGSDLNITYNGLSLNLCSGSENYITRFVLQAAFSLRFGDNFLIVDALDILDKKGRNGVFAVLTIFKITSLVCSTIYNKKDLPKLEKIGGRSYWVEGGKIG